MRKLLAGLIALVSIAAAPAYAQTNSAIVVATCGTPPTTYTAGQPFPLTQDTTGVACTSTSGGGGTSAVNLTQVGGTSVVTGGVNGSQGVGGLAADGAAAAGNPVQTGGVDATGAIQAVRTDAFGGFIGGTATGTPTRTTLTASASTALPGATATTRPSYLRFTVETALTSNLFLCLNNQTCSATVYDELIPSGAAAGTRLFEEIPFTAAVTYFTTTTPTVNATRLAN